MAQHEREKPVYLFKLGDRVQIRHYGGGPGRIVELRGPLGPGGAQIYRVRVGRKPTRSYIEVREDQLELVPAKSRVSVAADIQANPWDAQAAEDGSMVERDWKNPTLLFKLGDRVKIRQSGGLRGRIIEWRGPLGPKGEHIDRVILRRKPTPAYIEVREDQLELVPVKS